MNRPCFLFQLSAICLGAMLLSAPTAGFDLLRPIEESFPPGIGIGDVEATKEGLPEAAEPSYEDQLIELVNHERWSNGQLAPLKRADLLDTSSETHSSNMAARDFVMHCDPDTFTMPWDRMVAAGYNYSSAGENIAWGYPDPSAVIAGWMASSGHRANILSTTYREMGNGYYNQAGDQGNVRRTTSTGCTPNVFNEGPFYRYWTQNFGKRSSVYPLVINREAYLTDIRDVDLYLYNGGTEIRLRNESGTWTTWQPYAGNLSWQLSPGNGTKTVSVEMRTGSTVRSSSDTIILEGASDLIFEDDFDSGFTSAWSAVIS